MPRYFFNIEDHQRDEDLEGTEFAGPDEARVAAVIFAGEFLREHPELVRDGQRFSVDVQDEARTLSHAIAALSWKERRVAPASYIVREGQLPQRCAFIIEGYAYRQKLTVNGEREITSILVPGDLIDLQNLYLNQADHDVVSLTAMTIVEAPISELRALAQARPMIAAAMWTDALVEASIYREWLLNIGRRPAKARLAHLLSEFHARLRVIDRAGAMEYELPMTQELLGDAMGLTPVHVNRVLKMLESEGLITRHKRQIKVIDWDRLRAAADFNDRYLHLDQCGGLATASL